MSEKIGLFKKHILENKQRTKNLNHFHLRTIRWKYNTKLTQGISYSFLKWKKPVLWGIAVSLILDYKLRYNIPAH
jgi:hypothetical protein